MTAATANTRAIWKIDSFTDRAVGWVKVTNLVTAERLYFDFDASSEKCRSEGQARAQARAWIANRGGAR